MVHRALLPCLAFTLVLASCGHDGEAKRAEVRDASPFKAATADSLAKEAAERQALIDAMKRHPSIVDPTKASGAIKPRIDTRTVEEPKHAGNHH